MKDLTWWKQALLGTALGVLLLAIFTACGAAVLWIIGKLTGTAIDDLFYNGFRVGVLAGALLLAAWAAKKKKQPK